jgi:hypothetical protein
MQWIPKIHTNIGWRITNLKRNDNLICESCV